MPLSTFDIPEDLGTSRHAAVGAWFFGPRAENFDHLENSFKVILDNQKEARQSTYPDTDFITTEMKETALYTKQIDTLNERLAWVTKTLSATSVPFWSPRYNAHMSMESSMPAVIGYLAGLLHNQNNVATEASALTTWLETQVGKGLCRMLGYNILLEDPSKPKRPRFIPGHKIPSPGPGDPEDDEPSNEKDRPIGWGHITCGGSVANLESIWAARNLKFYPLSLKWALETTSQLAFLKASFRVTTCNGAEKLFMECTTWELLNLKPSVVLNIPAILYDNFGVSQNTLTKVLQDFSIQTLGKDVLEQKFGIIEKAPQMLVGTTKHYSWPKGAAIAGIGKKQIINVPIDERARMDSEALKGLLQEAVDSQRAIYAVVAIIGSTEHGAVDPLVQVLKLRQEFEKKGLSFVVHCDGAWGGYFASCVRQFDDLKVNPEPKLSGFGDTSFVPTMALTPYTQKQLEWFGRADSITIDPHKSGYCPYPAGGLCYRDGRMRFLVTWTSPVVFRGEQESIGVYGVEGSKPGASAVGTWLSHKVIGLDQQGYGTLLGEAIFTTARLYCHWVTMEFETQSWKDFPGVNARVVVTPMIMLPAERDGKSNDEIEKQKEFIRERIISKSNEDIYNDKEAAALISELGGDLQINTFAVNFELNGKINENVVEANYLNNRIFNRTSITDWQDKEKTLKDVKLFLTSTVFAESEYGKCLDTYKRRLGVKGDQDLYTLINVTMNPWATSKDFVREMADEFQKIANEELLHVVSRNIRTADTHGFIIQGIEGDRVCAVHLPMFNMANHRRQLVISCDLPKETLEVLRRRKMEKPETFFTFANLHQDLLEDLTKEGNSFTARIDEQIPHDENTEPLIKEVNVSNIKHIYDQSMGLEALVKDYPENMLLYVYSAQRGTDHKPIFHVDHLLNVTVNIQLNSDTVQFATTGGYDQSKAETIVKEDGAWFRLADVHERVIQPLLQNDQDSNIIYDKPGISWKPGAKFAFEAMSAKDGPPRPDTPVLFAGKLTLGSSVFADAEMINMDAPVPVTKPSEDEAISHVYHPATGFSVLGLQQSNASGLVAEYPNYLQMPELRNRNQTSRMMKFRKSLLEADAPADIYY